MKKHKTSPWLVIGAIGIVFGDIGTSPLYALQAIFGISKLPFSPQDILGAVSLIIWAITIVVTVKYVGLVMRANNNGEGGIMALIALMKRTDISQRKKIYLTLLGLIGVSLFYGDSVITPAISVLSAVEGTKLIAPQLTSYIVPITLVILTGLFWLQSRGTASLGKLFAPIMITWFSVSAIAGGLQIIHHPEILTALLPTTALDFFTSHPFAGFVSMGAVILSITGAEALYADMGHFGRPAISKAWLFFVFPALLLTYLGQGALVINSPHAITSAYFLMFPEWLHIPVILLATIATLIASQAVISGAFSLTRQAVHLGFAPRLTIRHTSREEIGQIYLPALNWILMILVFITVILFGSSSNLAGAFGFAVCGALAVDTIFLMIIMRKTWHYSLIIVIFSAVVFMSIDVLFLTSSLSKLLHGAWFPIIIALLGFTLFTTWYRGHSFINRERQRAEGSLLSFVRKLRRMNIPRIPGYAVYLGHHAGYAPLALHETLDQLRELHENVVVVTVETSDKPHIPERSRVVFDGLGHPDDGISHVTLQFGYKDTPNVPKALELARAKSKEVDFDPYEATYFTSVSQPVIVSNHRMPKWRKRLYIFMDRNANNPTDYFRLPLEKTVEMRAFLEL
ncbi:MAG: KUP/HAK/KT family potassium transporter [Candidatus Saccharimonadales bacterium]